MPPKKSSSQPKPSSSKPSTPAPTVHVYYDHTDYSDHGNDHGGDGGCQGSD